MRSQVEINGVKYPVSYYGLDNCSFYTDMNTGEDVMYTAPMVHLGDGFNGESGGEMDLPLDMSWEDAKGIANHVAEQCGYLAQWNEEQRYIKMYGQYQVYQVFFDDLGKIIDIENITIAARIESIERDIKWAQTDARGKHEDWIVAKGIELLELYVQKRIHDLQMENKSWRVRIKRIEANGQTQDGATIANYQSVIDINNKEIEKLKEELNVP